MGIKNRGKIVIEGDALSGVRADNENEDGKVLQL
jgi:hypothetical protein